ncbi:MAG: metallophosphoesterase [Oscillospiraceae bacterium]|nr:metallophosphoesterase [Oscillospiraceae bacterium]
MSLYAIGDLHLSLGTDKPMDVFGGEWDNYVEKIKAGFAKLRPDDVCVICGDVSWGMSLEESLEDFRFIGALPGKKIILKGNHDYWWMTVSKMASFFEKNGINGVDILNNNCYFYENAAICGTRGWLTEGEFDTEHNQKIMARETLRLRASLAAAGDAEVKLCFFHYPPRFKDMVCADMIEVMDEFSVKKCWYGHIHGLGRKFAVRGIVGGIDYEMVSADFVDFEPQLVM